MDQIATTVIGVVFDHTDVRTAMYASSVNKKWNSYWLRFAKPLLIEAKQALMIMCNTTEMPSYFTVATRFNAINDEKKIPFVTNYHRIDVHRSALIRIYMDIRNDQINYAHLHSYKSYAYRFSNYLELLKSLNYNSFDHIILYINAVIRKYTFTSEQIQTTKSLVRNLIKSGDCTVTTRPALVIICRFYDIKVDPATSQQLTNYLKECPPTPRVTIDIILYTKVVQITNLVQFLIDIGAIEQLSFAIPIIGEYDHTKFDLYHNTIRVLRNHLYGLSKY